MTPEGKVKKAINKVLDKYKGKVYKFMPVPGGFGPSSLDYILCVGGSFLAIEAKAPGKKPTPRQNAIIGAIIRAGGTVIVVDSAEWVYGSPLVELDAAIRRRLDA
jgi:hypothetical protein